MQSVYNTVKGTALGIADQLTPLLKESCFRERGMLTPEEFVDCGDQLVHSCPTWSWAGGDPAYGKSYLPADKQFLLTRNVPCHRRCKQLDHDISMECVLDAVGDGGDSEGWVDTHHYSGGASANNTGIAATTASPATGAAGDLEATAVAMETKAATRQNPSVSAASTRATGPADGDSDDDDDGDDDPCDMEAFEEAGLDDDDPGRVMSATCPTSSPSGGQQSSTADDDEEHATVLRTRTYNLNITYDNYYRTPRIWLHGFDENRLPLSVDAMYEDFSEDHAHKTITMENHPHLPGPPQASVHPCKHADTMKKLVETAEDGGREISVQKYLIVFLKFMQAVIPTIEYDFTQNIRL